MSEIALVLAGHGSHISPQTAGIVWRYVDRLRQCGVADEITACFWKEPPSFRQVFDTLLAEQVVVVPVFTARGYFTQDVIPNEMGLTGAVTVKGKKTIMLTRTVGEHPMLEKIVQAFVRETMVSYDLPAEETALAIIGHGTRRNPQSRDATRHQAARLRDLALVSEVVDVYLDDVPDIPSLYQSTNAANIIALPYFLASGSHVSLDVPSALGLRGDSRPELVNGRDVYYGDPVGIDDRMCQVILELAQETGLPVANKDGTGHWSGFPQAGRRTLLRTLANEKTLCFGQIGVSRKRVWRGEQLGDYQSLESPEQLRSFLRDAPFRPLPTSRDLPTAWQVELENPQQAHAVLETVYPGLVADWAAAHNGQLRTESLAEVSSRQQGVFRDIHRLGEDSIASAVQLVCGDCVRHPTWWDHNQDSSLPCISACNMWLTTAVKRGEAVG